MTFNIAGGRNIAVDREILPQVIAGYRPDIVALQEAWQIVTLDGRMDDVVESISWSLGGFPSIFCPTLSMSEQFHVSKAALIDGLFADWCEWRLGNGLISRWDFTRLGDSALPGKPVNVPIFRPAVYEGTRDTDPRWVILSRINCGPVKPFVLVCHLTTLLGERRGSTPAIKGKTLEAQIIRSRQTGAILDLISKHILEKNQFAILMGDFNAVAAEPCLHHILEKEAGFIRLIPDQEVFTHPKAPTPIDHILVFPGKYRLDYHCWVDENPELAKVSDHRPVIADITIENASSNDKHLAMDD